VGYIWDRKRNCCMKTVRDSNCHSESVFVDTDYTYPDEQNLWWFAWYTTVPFCITTRFLHMVTAHHHEVLGKLYHSHRTAFLVTKNSVRSLICYIATGEGIYIIFDFSIVVYRWWRQNSGSNRSRFLAETSADRLMTVHGSLVTTCSVSLIFLVIGLCTNWRTFSLEMEMKHDFYMWMSWPCSSGLHFLYQQWEWLQNTYIFILNTDCPGDCHTSGRSVLLLAL